MNKKKLIIAILGLAIVVAFIGYKMYNKPHVDVAKAKSDITLTANTILNDFTTNETAANAKYLEKIIAVTGEVSNIKIEKDKGIVTLKTNDDFGSVLCHLSENATKNINSIKEGQTVTIKGICTGYLMDVILVKGELLIN